MTLTEKLLSRASGKGTVSPGDNVWVNVDVLLTHDVCGPGTIGVFKREFGQDAKVWDARKIVIIPDHYIFTADSLSNRNVDILRDFVREQGLPYFYDVIDEPDGHWKFDASQGQLKRQYGSHFAGVCHTALPRKGHTRPGEVLFGTDSHTCMAGAFGLFATGIGNTDAGFILGTGKLLIKVPETMRFYLEGAMQPGIMAKDIILDVIGDIGFDGATYRAMQWEGPAASAMNMDDRMTIANMAIEAGGKNGIFPADRTTFDYVDERTAANGTKSDYEPVELDRAQHFCFDRTYDLSKLEPTVAMHPDPGNRALAKDLGNISLDRAYIGSCTGGKTTDFLAFARIVRGKSVRIDTFGVPATPDVVEELKSTRWDDHSVWEILTDAGVTMTENASCAACLGGPVDTFGRLNTPMNCISATNRNFPGRMGSKESRVYLASPYTVAASALTGRITDPRGTFEIVRFGVNARDVLMLACFLAAGCAAPRAATSAGPRTDRYVVIATRTPFYQYGPAQGLGPDYQLVAGQPVKLLQRDYGFSKVQTDTGKTGYVSTDDIAPALTAPPPPAPSAAPKPKLSKSRQPPPTDFSQPNEMALPTDNPTFRY